MAGRPVGSGNKDSQQIRVMLRQALEAKGGSAYFIQQADENPNAFMGLVAKLIPSEINHGGQEDNPINHSVEVSIVTNSNTNT
jgi:hypothetical protein